MENICLSWNKKLSKWSNWCCFVYMLWTPWCSGLYLFILHGWLFKCNLRSIPGQWKNGQLHHQRVFQKRLYLQIVSLWCLLWNYHHKGRDMADENTCSWYCLDVSVQKLAPWMIISKRSEQAEMRWEESLVLCALRTGHGENNTTIHFR